MKDIRVAYRLTAILLLLLAVLLGAFVLAGKRSVEAYVQEAVRECSSTEGSRSECYERTIVALYPRLSVEEIFAVVREMRELDPEYQFCHVLGHKLGEKAVERDPARWLEVMPQNPPDGLCSNGFIHGVVGGRFRADVLDEATLEKSIPDFSRACEPRENWAPSPLDQAICYHGMGHLYMFITDADVPKALSLCERTAEGNNPGRDFRTVCREGVFMQIYQPLEPDDFLLIERMPEKPTKETVRQFCARYERPEYVGACLRESWPLFREELFEGGEFAAFCSDQPNEAEETTCYMAAFTIFSRQSLEDPQKVLEVCSKAPTDRRGLCYFSGAQALLEEDRAEAWKAIDFCNAAPSPYARKCLEELLSTVQFNFASGTQGERDFCAVLPVDMQARCPSSE